MSAGDYSTRVGLKRQDNLGQLALAFDTLAQQVDATHKQLQEKIEELQKSQRQVIHAQRMDAVGKLAGGIAHDFNNLLTIIIGETELAMAGAVDAETRGSLEEIRRAGQHAAGLTRQLLAFSRRQLVEPTTFNINQLLGEIGKMLPRLIPESAHLVLRPAPEELLALADRGQVEQVIINLVVNARDAMRKAGDIVLATSSVALDEGAASEQRELRPGEYVVISVSDTGSGMSEEVKAHIFEPFFTTKEPGRGTGLGLATSYGIVKQAGGHIAVYSEAGFGTTVKVYLPRVRQPTTEPSLPPVPLPRGTETILLTEDYVALRYITSKMLRAQGYDVLEAGNAEEALRILREYNGPIHLLLTDVVLPTMGGRELAEQAANIHPGIRILYATGYTDDVILQHQLVAHDVLIVQKPFTTESLGRKVREALGVTGERVSA